MTRYVVDASVALKWLVHEEHSAAAIRLQQSGYDLTAPDLLLIKVTNALWVKVRRGELSPDEAEIGLTAATLLPVSIEPTLPLLPITWKIATAHQRSVYNSLYVALALTTGAPLVTADRKFFNALRSTPLASHLLWVADIPGAPEQPDDAPPA